MCSRSNSSGLAGARISWSTPKALVTAPAASRVPATPSGPGFHTELCRMVRLRNRKRNLRLRLSASSRGRVAVESGLEAANRFDLGG
jgi:hypothetical protein